MASRFWVGGAASWTTINTANWSATSGGASGASVPGSSDDVVVDSASGSNFTITCTGALACNSITFVGSTASIGGTGSLTVSSSFTLRSGMSFSLSGNFLNFGATSTGKTITTAGVNINASFRFNGVGGGWTLQDALTNNDTGVTLTSGTLDLNGKTVTTGDFVLGIGTKTLTPGAATINVSGTLDLTTNNANFTLTAHTATINMTGASKILDGGGLSLYNVNAVGNNLTILGSNTYNIFNATSGNTLIFTSLTSQTALTNFNLINNTVRSSVAGSAFNLIKTTGSVIMRACSVKDCHASGGATFSAIRSSTSVSGNTGITFGSYAVVEKQVDGRKYTLNASGVLTII